MKFLGLHSSYPSTTFISCRDSLVLQSQYEQNMGLILEETSYQQDSSDSGIEQVNLRSGLKGAIWPFNWSGFSEDPYLAQSFYCGEVIVNNKVYHLNVGYNGNTQEVFVSCDSINARTKMYFKKLAEGVLFFLKNGETHSTYRGLKLFVLKMVEVCLHQ